MTFKSKPHRYTLDLAPTHRAQCRVCKRKIERGAARLVIDMFVRPGRRTRRAVHADGCVSTAMAVDVVRVLGGSADGLQVVGMGAGDSVRLRAIIAARAMESDVGAGGDGAGAGVGGGGGAGDEIDAQVGAFTQPVITAMLRQARRVESVGA